MEDLYRLCPGCMRMLDDPNIPCPYCGFDKRAYERTRDYRTLPPFTVLAGKYLLGKVLGKGGFGITYLAWEINLEIPVAIKEYFPADLAIRDTSRGGEDGKTVRVVAGDQSKYYESELESFKQEAKNLAKFLNLPGVVWVKELFSENCTAYLVMEYVPGITLKEYLRSKGNRLDEQTVLRLMYPVMDSLDKIHKKGIIHRDISPDNILITQDQKVTLIDFGAARRASNNNEKDLTVLLKPGYAPEEQYRTKGRQGPWTDVYAICATLYRMISGKVPEEAVDRIEHDEVKPLTVLAREEHFQVSRRVSDVIQRGMSVQATHRYLDVQSLIQDLYRKEPQKVSTWPDPGEKKANDYRPDPNWEEAPRKSYAGIIMGVLVVLLAVTAVLGYVIVQKKSQNSGNPGGAKADVSSGTEVDKGEDSKEVLEPVTAKLVELSQVDLSEYRQVRVASAEASSVIQQTNGAVNTPMMIFDENIETNWQEGVDGPGLGEWIDAKLSQESQVKYLTFKLGNWKTSRYYYGNNRPSKMTITVGEFSQQVEFRDQWEEFCLEFSRPCEAESLRMTIDEVYVGTDWDDTCITDMRIYAKE